MKAGDLEVKGYHLRRGGRKENLKRIKASQIFKAKAVDLEHSKAKKDNDLEWFDENFLIEVGNLIEVALEGTYR